MGASSARTESAAVEGLASALAGALERDEGQVPAANEFARGARFTGSIVSSVGNIAGAAVDTAGISAEAASMYAFDTSWKYTPLSVYGQDEGGSFGSKVWNRGTDYALSVTTVTHWKNQYQYFQDPTPQNAARVHESAPSLLIYFPIAKALSAPKTIVPGNANAILGSDPGVMLGERPSAPYIPEPGLAEWEFSRSAPQETATGAQWLAGRYTQTASRPNAYWESARRVFPTRRNSGLSGSDLRAEQEMFATERLGEGALPGEIRGQARQAGLDRRGGVNNVGGPDRLADPGAENAIQRAIQKVAAGAATH